MKNKLGTFYGNDIIIEVDTNDKADYAKLFEEYLEVIKYTAVEEYKRKKLVKEIKK